MLCSPDTEHLAAPGECARYLGEGNLELNNPFKGGGSIFIADNSYRTMRNPNAYRPVGQPGQHGRGHDIPKYTNGANTKRRSSN